MPIAQASKPGELIQIDPISVNFSEGFTLKEFKASCPITGTTIMRACSRASSRNARRFLEHLEMAFPAPRMADDPDILVIGSENGLGKTSIIECCAWLLLVSDMFEEKLVLRMNSDVLDFFVRAGAYFARISGDIVVDDHSYTVDILIDSYDSCIKIIKDFTADAINEEYSRILDESGGYLYQFDPEIAIFSEDYDDDMVTTDTAKINIPLYKKQADDFISAISGFTHDPVLDELFLLFHSNRKVHAGNPALGMMLEQARPGWDQAPVLTRYEAPMDAFKITLLRSLMDRGGLFELFEKPQDSKPKEVIEKLNELMARYAGGTIGKLRPSPDNSIDFRVTPVNGGKSFTFDGLSSGQKEIISTLFLIWQHTRDNPSVVFIDEPELHLNAQWHRSFVATLLRLAPHNQYILATHSEDVMDSVDPDRRMLLTKQKKKEDK